MAQNPPLKYINIHGPKINLPDGIEVGGYEPEYRKDEAIPPDPARPPSPFALRYGVSYDVAWRLYHPDKRAHSCLAPEFPDSNDQPPGKIPKLSNDELDRLFYSERSQLWVGNYGVKTWQLPALSERLYYLGHGIDSTASNSYSDWLKVRDQMIRVDQEKWLSCFKRNHWFDLRTNPLRSLQNPTPGLENSFWSMDNESLAKNVDIAIEFFHRVLRQLCAEQNEFLDALLFNEPEPCGKDPRYDFNEKDDVYSLKPRPKDKRATAEKLWSEIEEKTKDLVYFGFTDENTADDASAITSDSVHGFLGVIVTFAVHAIRSLFEMDATINHRCLALFALSSTMLHEFAHVLLLCKHTLTLMPIEPFYNGEWLSELGYSFENVIFGGPMTWQPLPSIIFGKRASFFSHMVQLDWPGLLMMRRTAASQIEYNAVYGAKESDQTCYPVPPLWIAAILSEKYWTEVVSQRGSAAFRPPRILSSRVNMFDNRRPDNTLKQGHLEHFMTARPHNPPNWSVPELQSECQNVLQRWEAKRSDMAKRRSEWYDVEYASWRLLPWSETNMRKSFNRFIHFHSKRNLAECRKIEVFFHGIDDIRKAMDNRKLFSMQHILALLMYATLSHFVSGLFTCSLVTVPFTTPVEITPPKRRTALLWPSSSAIEWWNENTKPEEVALGVEDEKVKARKSLRGLYSKIIKTPLQGCKMVETLLQKIEHIQGGPKQWIDALNQCYLTIKSERSANTDPNIWVNFNFSIPPYDPNWVKSKDLGGFIADQAKATYVGVKPWHDLARESVRFVTPPNSPPPTVSALSTSMGQLATRDRSQSTVEGYTPIIRPFPQYFYISHVANHRSLDNAWVVEPDNDAGFNVFRISDLLKELGATEEDYRAVVVTGPQGPVLTRGDPRADAIRARFSNMTPIGKLIMSRRAEEVAECDGLDGQPAWVSIGAEIFDITNFPFKPSDEALGLRQCAGGPISGDIMESQRTVDELLSRLSPYLCASLDIPTPARNMQYFTPRELRWHDNPDLGVYMAVDNAVYDITTYMRFHPGGNQLLLHYTGRDATQAFQGYHDLSIMETYESLKIGYLVPEIDMKDMKTNHVAVHDRVFDISTLANEDPGLYTILQKYCGVDTTSALCDADADDDGAGALATLFINKKNLIVAGLAKTSLPDFPRGELKNYSNHRTPSGAVVIVNGYVYNTTHLMQYPEMYEQALGPNWAGREITIPNLAEWIARNFEARCIGRLVDGPEREQPDMNVDPDEAHEDQIPSNRQPWSSEDASIAGNL